MALWYVQYHICWQFGNVIAHDPIVYYPCPVPCMSISGGTGEQVHGSGICTLQAVLISNKSNIHYNCVVGYM